MSGRAAQLSLVATRVGADLVRYGTRLTGDHATGEDLAQEALLRAWRDRAILAGSNESARRWLFTVVRHLAIDQARSARRRREVPVAEPPETARQPPEGDLVERDALHRALLGLPARQRHAVVAVYLADESPLDAAQAAGVPLGTLRSRLHYGLAALRVELSSTDR